MSTVEVAVATRDAPIKEFEFLMRQHEARLHECSLCNHLLYDTSHLHQVEAVHTVRMVLLFLHSAAYKIACVLSAKPEIQVSRNQNPSNWRVVRDNPKQKWV